MAADIYPIRRYKSKKPNNDNWVYLLISLAAIVLGILAYSLLK